MKTQSIDTNPKMEELMISLIRNASIEQKISKVRSLSQTIMYLSRRAIKRANPDLTEKEIKTKYIAYHYGDNLANLYSKALKRKSL
ncbi:hypothetical protein MHK_007998 [Candidatus Magnetomorum sp. HK-1]|nr:hypothetical protein MHK_007998 [Candidatus Magnetomorum sp. HK-1]